MPGPAGFFVQPARGLDNLIFIEQLIAGNLAFYLLQPFTHRMENSDFGYVEQGVPLIDDRQIAMADDNAVDRGVWCQSFPVF